MTDFNETIDSYLQSIALVQARIQELNQHIAVAAEAEDPKELQSLHERRYLLYTELWEMESSVKSMREYIARLPLLLRQNQKKESALRAGAVAKKKC